MADPKLIQEWLQKADEDLGFAVSIIEDSPFYAQICFHYCKLLSRYYIDTRYPVHWPTDYTKGKASLAQAAAEAIRDTVKACLK
jgi:HEPN domain-containing protein